ncbi:hypothetical protein [Kitasatospora sp. NPDC057198]|uniref:hypothetical protein n=1 Tax=Kitasatospora sp. NPDC057198 TaxID=3346046 RepID=UPI00363B21B5
MLRRSSVVLRVTGLGAATGTAPYLLLGGGAALSGMPLVGLALVALGLLTGAFTGLAVAWSLAACRVGAPTRRWSVRAALAAGPALVLAYLIVAVLTGGPFLFAVGLFGSPIAVVVAALAGANLARRVGPFAWVPPEEVERFAKLHRARTLHPRRG